MEFYGQLSNKKMPDIFHAKNAKEKNEAKKMLVL
jgi:hypothetical protein